MNKLRATVEGGSLACSSPQGRKGPDATEWTVGSRAPEAARGPSHAETHPHGATAKCQRLANRIVCFQKVTAARSSPHRLCPPLAQRGSSDTASASHKDGPGFPQTHLTHSGDGKPRALHLPDSQPRLLLLLQLVRPPIRRPGHREPLCPDLLPLPVGTPAPPRTAHRQDHHSAHPTAPQACHSWALAPRENGVPTCRKTAPGAGAQDTKPGPRAGCAGTGSAQLAEQSSTTLFLSLQCLETRHSVPGALPRKTSSALMKTDCPKTRETKPKNRSQKQAGLS